MELRDTCFLQFADVATWLDLDPEKVSISGDTKSTKVIQDLTYTAKLVGEDGNGISIEYLTGGTAGSELVAMIGHAIQVQIENGVSTANQIQTAIEASAMANATVGVSVSGVGTNTQNVVSKTYLVGGAFSAEHNTNLYNKLKIIMNTVCNTIETYTQTPILYKAFREDYDGNSSNVIILHQWPVRQILDLKIDYNRNFPTGSEEQTDNYFLRGKEFFQKYSFDEGSDPQVHIIGQDLVLRDDNEQFIIGRIFSGSILGSLRVRYEAGWAQTIDQVPDDILQAALFLCQYWNRKQDNNDIGIASKGVRGESYTVVKSGIPKDVKELLDPYANLSFGTHPVPRKNFFGV